MTVPLGRFWGASRITELSCHFAVAVLLLCCFLSLSVLFSPSLSPKVHLLGSFILVLPSSVAVRFLFPGAVYTSLFSLSWKPESKIKVPTRGCAPSEDSGGPSSPCPSQLLLTPRVPWLVSARTASLQPVPLPPHRFHLSLCLLQSTLVGRWRAQRDNPQ